MYVFISCFYLCLPQIYFYADYVFRESGIPDDKIPYVTVGTGACECITALTCVSISYSRCYSITMQFRHSFMLQQTKREIRSCAQQLVGMIDYFTHRTKCTSHARSFGQKVFRSCDMLCVLQGMLIESVGRKVLIIGGYTLMSICCILLTLTLNFQVKQITRHCKNNKMIIIIIII